MFWLFLILIASQALVCKSQFSYSALSCVIRTLDKFSAVDIQKFSLVVNNKTVSRSIESKIKFKLYTHEHPEGIEISVDDENSLQSSSFDPKRPTRIITHGFNGAGSHDSCAGPSKAFLENGDFNVIIMDWYNYQTGGFWFPIYLIVVKQIKSVGLYLTKMIDFLELHGMNLNTTTLIGHSLGAHVVGIAGYHAKNKVNHIVGLDPAEPFLTNKNPGERISDQDAYNVEVIHTNGNHCGMLKPLGHYDFYPNGGIKQPGCNSNSCSHQRVHFIYSESLQSSTAGFYGRRCPDANNIEKEKCTGEVAILGGINRSPMTPGIYYLETNDQYPFAQGSPS